MRQGEKIGREKKKRAEGFLCLWGKGPGDLCLYCLCSLGRRCPEVTILNPPPFVDGWTSTPRILSSCQASPPLPQKFFEKKHPLAWASLPPCPVAGTHAAPFREKKKKKRESQEKKGVLQTDLRGDLELFYVISKLRSYFSSTNT